MGDSNMQYVTSTSFLLLAYAKYLTTAHKFVDCGGITVTPNRLRALAKRQVQPMRITFLFHLTIMMSPKQFYYNRNANECLKLLVKNSAKESFDGKRKKNH